MLTISEQICWLLLLALPVGCVSWTLAREEILREPREWLQTRSETSPRWWQRKFFFMWTCEYCLSHYVAAAAVAATGLQLLLEDWRGYGLAWLAVTAVANVYMSAYSRLRVEIRKERAELDRVERKPRRAG